eukprot:COSAG06_NODE_5936_length_3200_cov_4.853273_1_plen_85_part_10
MPADRRLEPSERRGGFVVLVRGGGRFSRYSSREGARMKTETVRRKSFRTVRPTYPVAGQRQRPRGEVAEGKAWLAVLSFTAHPPN